MWHLDSRPLAIDSVPENRRGRCTDRDELRCHIGQGDCTTGNHGRDSRAGWVAPPRRAGAGALDAAEPRQPAALDLRERRPRPAGGPLAGRADRATPARACSGRPAHHRPGPGPRRRDAGPQPRDGADPSRPRVADRRAARTAARGRRLPASDGPGRVADRPRLQGSARSPKPRDPGGRCRCRRVVAEALAEHIAAFPPSRRRHLFTTRTDEPYRHDYYGIDHLPAAVARAGLPAGTTSHDLRHHYASVLLAAGESVLAVAERLGHENATLVL